MLTPIISQCSNTQYRMPKETHDIGIQKSVHYSSSPNPITTDTNPKYTQCTQVHTHQIPTLHHSFEENKKKGIFNFLFIPRHFLAFPVEPHRKGNTVTKLKRLRDHPASQPPRLRILYPIPTYLTNRPSRCIHIYELSPTIPRYIYSSKQNTKKNTPTPHREVKSTNKPRST
ncbi:hypothetical protein BGX38DRAFT_418795 [Terfezia claveryi]|nr:hypothetical protein BGX38DRAFT_418795 [Terfezia claveryi]